MSNNSRISFLLADDHMIVRQGVELIIRDLYSDILVFNASSISQIKNIFEKNHIDFAILDAQYPDGNCSEILESLKKTNPNLKILIFSSYEEEIYATRFFDIGADGFISKLSDEVEIKNAIISLYENGEYKSPFIKKLLTLQKHNSSLLNPLANLSEREMQIAKLLADGCGNLEIANELSLKQNTISTYKKRVFEKLNIDSIVELNNLIKRYNDF